MTPQDMEIQRLRQKVKELEHIHQLDQAEIVGLRRYIETLAQGEQTDSLLSEIRQ